MAIGWTYVARAGNDLADLLDGLTPEQLTTPSLTEGLSVLEVGGLFAGIVVLTPFKLVIGIAKHRGNEEAFLAEKAKELSASGVESVSRILRERSGEIAKGVTEESMVTLAAVQTLNITRSLGIANVLDPEVMMIALDNSVDGLPERLVGDAPRLEATDSDWARGDGLVVRGTREAILLALSDLALFDEVEGEGVSLLP